MIAVAQHIFYFLAQNHRTQRQAAADALGGGDNIRRDAVMHVGVQLAGSAVARLHLVYHEEDILFAGDLCRGLYEFFGEYVDAALALHALDQNAGDVPTGGDLFQLNDVVCLDVAEAGGQRLKQSVKMILPRGSECSQRPSVKTVFQRDDGVAVRALFLRRVFPCHFDGALVGFRA